MSVSFQWVWRNCNLITFVLLYTTIGSGFAWVRRILDALGKLLRSREATSRASLGYRPVRVGPLRVPCA